MDRPRRWLRRPCEEWWDLATTAAVTLAVEVGIRTLPLPTVARAAGVPLAAGPGATRQVTPGSAHPAVAPFTPVERRRLRATRTVLRRWPFGDTCLRHALVAGHHLRRRSPRLQIGVAKIDGDVKAHAWLDLDGGILDPMHSADGYRTLERPRSHT